MKNTNSFKKRFHGLNLKDKVQVSELVRDVVISKKMPSGKVLKDKDLEMVKELSDWCDENIFFNKMPNGEYAQHTYGMK